MARHPADSSDFLKDHIKAAEGLRLTAYLDAAGVPTIGWGHIKNLTRADVGVRKITEARALALFEADLDEAETAVRRYVKVDLNQNQFDALVDFVFNLGGGAFAKSTLLKKLNAGDYAAVPGQLMRWTKAKHPKTRKLRELAGLVKRRRWEADLWSRTVTVPSKPFYEPEDSATVIPTPTRENTSLWTIIINFILALFGGRSG